MRCRESVNNLSSFLAASRSAWPRSQVSVEGPLGKLYWKSSPRRGREYRRGSQAGPSSSRATTTRQARALHGLSRALMQNMVVGVTKGYEKKLEIVGVGYLAAIQKGVLQLRVGFANEIHMPIPAGLTVTCPDQTHIVIKGADKQLVGQFAAEVRASASPSLIRARAFATMAKWSVARPVRP